CITTNKHEIDRLFGRTFTLPTDIKCHCCADGVAEIDRAINRPGICIIGVIARTGSELSKNAPADCHATVCACEWPALALAPQVIGTAQAALIIPTPERIRPSALEGFVKQCDCCACGQG